jgi:hypothetical protein
VLGVNFSPDLYVSVDKAVHEEVVELYHSTDAVLEPE